MNPRSFILISALSLSACTPRAQATPLVIPPLAGSTSEATAFVRVTTPPPSEPTKYPRAALDPGGPWLAYRDSEGELKVVNQDGTAMRSVTASPSVLVASPFSASSRHPYLVVLGSDGAPGPTLSVISFPNLTTLAQVKLKDCPSKVEGCIVDAEADVSMSPIWSPDGRYLAFIGAIEGPSADVYAFDAEELSLRRLTTGPNQVGNFQWSPDSQWIVHEEISEFYNWVVDAVWAARPDGSGVKWLYSPQTHREQVILGWLGSGRFAVYEHDWEGDNNLRLAGIEEGLVATLFTGYFHQGSMDPETGTTAFWAIPGAPDTPIEEPGTYIVSPFNTTPAMVDGPELGGATWDPRLGLFVSLDTCPQNPDELIAFDIAGKPSCTPKAKGVTSPDGRWVISFQGGLVAEDQVEGSSTFHSEYTFGPMLWAPDSSGFFLVQGPNLYHFEIPSFNAALVDDALLNENPALDYDWGHFTWVTDYESQP